jgi:SAM-dependent methyltransferase
MSTITKGMSEQYSDSQKLAARARLYQDSTVAGTPWFPWVAERLGLSGGEAVLDIGCGPGWFWAASAEIVPLDIALTLADQSAGMVEEAVGRCREAGFARVEGKQADAMALPFADQSFDVVVAMHMFYHLADQVAAMAEMHRVLKPGGRLVVTTNGRENLTGLYALSTSFGGGAVDPAAEAFGFERAEELMRAQFGAVAVEEHPAGLRVTDPETVYLALTSYPPGDRASEDQLVAFRAAIDKAFAAGDGVLTLRKQTGVFIASKA